jgi:hypothetical protein
MSSSRRSVFSKPPVAVLHGSFMPQGHEYLNGTLGGISYLLVPSMFWPFSLGRKWYPSAGALEVICKQEGSEHIDFIIRCL